MTSKETVEAWVTTYALSRGIEHTTGIVTHEISSTMLAYGPYAYAHGKDWHRTKDAALERAEEMRSAKIASLRKQIAKLEAMTFEVKE